jgi:hypothetical protein
VELPFAIPLTAQVTLAFEEPVTVGVSVTLPSGETVALVGETLIDTLFASVTEAAELPLPVDARIVTVEGDGRAVGAV